jgi:hypothetical protein
MRKKQKAQYRIRNWSEYNAALVKRGRLEVWVDEEVLAKWRAECKEEAVRGRPQVYSDGYIEMLLILGIKYKLTLREIEGFGLSLMKQLGLDLPIPDFSTLCRRKAKLEVEVSVRKLKGARVIAVDSSGLKVFGEGEWKVRQYGYSKRRTWRKIHLGVDALSGELVSVEGSTNDKSDDQMLPKVLEGIDPQIQIAQVNGDGGYDRRRSYQAIKERGAKAVIPPRKGAKIWQHGNCKAERLDRDNNLRRIRKIGKKAWKQESGYHQRSKAEVAMYRYKTLVGDTLNSRTEPNQMVDIKLGGKALNIISNLGMPDSYKVAA